MPMPDCANRGIVIVYANKKSKRLLRQI